MNDNQARGCTSRSTTIGYILAALAAPGRYHHVEVDGLPPSTVFVAEREAIIAVTTAPAPVFRNAIEQMAVKLHADVLLLRTGPGADALMPVSADVSLGALPCKLWVERDLDLWTNHRSLWLVPRAFGPSIAITAEGFCLELLPPYQTLAQREAGIYRAQHDLAYLAAPVGVR